jgi:hypothetical protein
VTVLAIQEPRAAAACGGAQLAGRGSLAGRGRLAASRGALISGLCETPASHAPWPYLGQFLSIPLPTARCPATAHEPQVCVSGSFDGTLCHWLVGQAEPQAVVTGAHDSSIWALAYHPLGHVLASGARGQGGPLVQQAGRRFRGARCGVELTTRDGLRARRGVAAAWRAQPHLGRSDQPIAGLSFRSAP